MSSFAQWLWSGDLIYADKTELDASFKSLVFKYWHYILREAIKQNPQTAKAHPTLPRACTLWSIIVFVAAEEGHDCTGLAALAIVL